MQPVQLRQSTFVHHMLDRFLIVQIHGDQFWNMIIRPTLQSKENTGPKKSTNLYKISNSSSLHSPLGDWIQTILFHCLLPIVIK